MALPITIPNTFANATTSIPLSQLDNNFSTVVVAINGIGNGAEALSNVNITGGNVTVTTVDATNLEVTNVKSKNGANAFVITDTTGNVSFDSGTLYVDAANNRVGFGTTAPSTLVDIREGNLQIIRTSSIPVLTVNSTQASGYAPAQLQLFRAGAASAATPNGSTLGEIRFDGLDANGSYMNTTTIRTDIGTNAAGGAPGSIIFLTSSSGASAAEICRFSNDKYIRMASGTGGIQFNGDTAAANALDDYEEGTWTPNISSNNGTGTFGTKVGSYVKIGKQVTIWFVVDGGSSLAAGTTQFLEGLPFTIGSIQDNTVLGQLGSNGPTIRTQQLQTQGGNRNVMYVYIGGTQETTTITYAGGCATYWID